MIRTPFDVQSVMPVLTEMRSGRSLSRYRNAVRNVLGLCGVLCGAETRAIAGLCGVCWGFAHVTRARAQARTHADARARGRGPAHPARPHRQRQACVSAVRLPVRGLGTPHRRPADLPRPISRARRFHCLPFPWKEGEREACGLCRAASPTLPLDRSALLRRTHQH